MEDKLAKTIISSLMLRTLIIEDCGFFSNVTRWKELERNFTIAATRKIQLPMSVGQSRSSKGVASNAFATAIRITQVSGNFREISCVQSSSSSW